MRLLYLNSNGPVTAFRIHSNQETGPRWKNCLRLPIHVDFLQSCWVKWRKFSIPLYTVLTCKSLCTLAGTAPQLLPLQSTVRGSHSRLAVNRFTDFIQPGLIMPNLTGPSLINGWQYLTLAKYWPVPEELGDN